MQPQFTNSGERTYNIIYSTVGVSDSELTPSFYNKCNNIQPVGLIYYNILLYVREYV